VTRVAVAGRGMGGVVALHLAAIDPEVAGVASLDSLTAFELLASTENYRWNAEAFLPGVLQHYELPDLAAGIDRPVLIVNPLDALREPLSPDDVKTYYTAAIDKNKAFRVMLKAGDDAVVAFLRETLQDR
jgi:pimeloyl-ACP methyl ester carboxylesterase